MTHYTSDNARIARHRQANDIDSLVERQRPTSPRSWLRLLGCVLFWCAVAALGAVFAYFY